MLGLIIGAAVAAKVIKNIASKPAQREGIRIGVTADEFEDCNYRDVIQKLINKGFTNIKANEIREYKNTIFNRNKFGLVRSVSVNGRTNYLASDYFPEDSPICVSFDVFKDSPHIAIPELELMQKNTESLYDGIPEIKLDLEKPASPIKVEKERYCDYCDSLMHKNWTYCHRCGAPISRNVR